MKRSIFVFLLFISSISFAQNGDKITYPRNTDELMNFMYQATLQGLRVIIVADSAGTTKTALDSAYATWAKQDTTNKRLDTLKTNILLLLTELAKKPNNNNADSLLNVGNLLTELAKVTNKLDSLFNYARADSLNTVQVDSVNNTYDSLIVNYTTWVTYSFSGDSTFVIDFDRNFTNPKVFAPGTGYTITLPIDGHNKIYQKKKSTFAGYMKRNLAAKGK